MKKLLLIAVVSALSACSAPHGAFASHGDKGMFERVAENNAKALNANASKVCDPLHAVELTGNDIVVEINNGYTKAAINGEFVKPTRINANFYEIKGAKYVVSISLNNDGVEDASWTARKGRAHGMLQTIEDSE